MTEIKLNATDLRPGDVFRHDGHGWVQWDGFVYRAVNQYVIAPDGRGEATLWHLTDSPSGPECVVTQLELDRLDRRLWPAVAAHFTGSAVS